jgi:regulator of nonsense transcripts 1
LTFVLVELDEKADRGLGKDYIDDGLSEVSSSLASQDGEAGLPNDAEAVQPYDFANLP